ncbi:adenylate kinase family protein [Planctomicrobium piriforme]|uniref:Adenylate kinase n=1 Tax=Planctomicrobium piriforme TaxID=1576369 RepID=A0A1I3LPJ9_9PLAN|nr:nucleoside monophosphate kinase [Planctomicrobium piriforme]SFI86612.1 adenylate kinase [Planctomicrobium piriforme]
MAPPAPLAAKRTGLKPRYPYPAALIFGVPGAGKGTQGEILTRIPGFFHLSSGVIFRKLDNHSQEGQIVKMYSAKGELAPDDVTVRVFLNWLEAQRAADRFRPREHLLLLDGIPRNIHQCQMLEEFIDVKALIHLTCHDEEAMIERIRRRAALENRIDDASDTVTRRRFEVYRQETEPVLDFYPKEVVKNIESTGIHAEVLLECLNYLVPVLKENFPRD